MSLRRRFRDLATATVRRIETRLAAQPPGPSPAASRSYFLALSEYQRRRQDPIPFQELAAHELGVSSQNGEDGVIQEILRRLGASDQPFFVEFGIENGSQGNAVLLADSLGWAGLFMERDL